MAITKTSDNNKNNHESHQCIFCDIQLLPDINVEWQMSSKAQPEWWIYVAAMHCMYVVYLCSNYYQVYVIVLLLLDYNNYIYKTYISKEERIRRIYTFNMILFDVPYVVKVKMYSQLSPFLFMSFYVTHQYALRNNTTSMQTGSFSPQQKNVHRNACTEGTI